MKGDAAAIASAATDREIHVIIRGNYHDAPSMQQSKRDDLRELGLSLGAWQPFPCFGDIVTSVYACVHSSIIDHLQFVKENFLYLDQTRSIQMN